MCIRDRYLSARCAQARVRVRPRATSRMSCWRRECVLWLFGTLCRMGTSFGKGCNGFRRWRNWRRADVVVVNKVGSAPQEGVDAVMQAVREVNPNARCIKVSSSLRVEDGGRLKGARALVVEDGPTLTHGGMSEGAGMVAAREYGVGEVVDPRSAAVGSIAEVYKRYPHLGSILPAIGYYPDQLRELEETVKGAAVDVVISATPLDIRRLIHVEVPVVQVDYELEELESPGVAGVVRGFLADHGLEGHG